MTIKTSATAVRSLLPMSTTSATTFAAVSALVPSLHAHSTTKASKTRLWARPQESTIATRALGSFCPARTNKQVEGGQVATRFEVSRVGHERANQCFSIGVANAEPSRRGKPHTLLAPHAPPASTPHKTGGALRGLRSVVRAIRRGTPARTHQQKRQ